MVRVPAVILRFPMAAVTLESPSTMENAAPTPTVLPSSVWAVVLELSSSSPSSVFTKEARIVSILVLGMTM